MLDHLFTRFGSQFREGGIIHAKFVVSNGPVFAAKSARPGSFHKRLALVKDTSTGFLKLTLDGGCRELALLGARHINIASPTDATLFLRIEQYEATVESTGVIKLKSLTGANPEAPADAAATDEIHFSLYVAK
jgi:hypothetical protein